LSNLTCLGIIVGFNRSAKWHQFVPSRSELWCHLILRLALPDPHIELYPQSINLEVPRTDILSSISSSYDQPLAKFFSRFAIYRLTPVIKSPLVFTKFLNLHVELQEIVMLFSLPDGREVDLRAGYDELLSHGRYESDYYHDLQLWWIPQSLQVPTGMYVNRHFRSFCLRHYTIVFQDAVRLPNDPFYPIAVAPRRSRAPRSLTCFSPMRDSFSIGMDGVLQEFYHELPSYVLYKMVQENGNDQIFSKITSITFNKAHRFFHPYAIALAEESRHPDGSFDGQTHYDSWLRESDSNTRIFLPFAYMSGLKKITLVDFPRHGYVANTDHDPTDNAVVAAGSPDRFGEHLIGLDVFYLLSTRIHITRWYRQMKKDIPAIRVVYKFAADGDQGHEPYRKGVEYDLFRHLKSWPAIAVAAWQATPGILEDELPNPDVDKLYGLSSDTYDPPLFTLGEYGSYRDKAFWEESRGAEFDSDDL
jgi:hypothetical protein